MKVKPSKTDTLRALRENSLRPKSVKDDRSITLAVPRGIELSRSGLEIKRELSFDEWLRFGRTLQTAEGAVQWWIGDYLNAGERAYGEKYAQAVDERRADTWRHYAWISNRVEICTRVHNLSWAHHREVAALEPAEQAEWLGRAEAESWSQRELNKAVQEAKRLPTPPLPEGKYRVIYADPPWKYSDELIEGYGAATHHYPPMSIEELCILAIRELAVDCAVLFIWATSPMLAETFKVIEAWGFDYKTSFVWDKVRHNYGHYNSVRHEFLLICVRGSCTPDSEELHDSVVEIERTDVHSEKPAYFRALIDQMYIPLDGRIDRIELFPRGDLPKHWHKWGHGA